MQNVQLQLDKANAKLTFPKEPLLPDKLYKEVAA